MTSSDSSNSTINALLRAEKEAKGVVETARGERKQQLKRAQMEANDHIIALKEQAQQEVKAADDAFKAKHADDLAAGEDETKIALVEVDRLAEANKENVIQMLVEWCTSVEPELHENLIMQMQEAEKSS
ncbi:uncharacterized protein LOC134842215 [Symsagittifera roscoffensis]|uniref:uncharacterized protein LOC134842215 n=1 Tax=Symsagittifera roscoffensis TaxID=84072 RepID=UPI00307C04E5